MFICDIFHLDAFSIFSLHSYFSCHCMQCTTEWKTRNEKRQNEREKTYGTRTRTNTTIPCIFQQSMIQTVIKQILGRLSYCFEYAKTAQKLSCSVVCWCWCGFVDFIHSVERTCIILHKENPVE